MLEIVCSEDALVQYDQSKIRAVIGTHCRFHGERITHCGYGICAELWSSVLVDYKHNKDDEYHYVWCHSYVVRPPWVINSLDRDSLRTISSRSDGELESPDWVTGQGPSFFPPVPPPLTPPTDDDDDSYDDSNDDDDNGGDNGGWRLA